MTTTFDETPAQLQAAIDGYFEGLIKRVPLRDKRGNLVCDGEGNVLFDEIASAPTMTGLALALGMTRMELLRYEGEPLMCDAIARARQRVEEYAEGRLYDRDGSRGARFVLTNNHEGWVEKADGGSTTNVLLIAGAEQAKQVLSGIAEYLGAVERQRGAIGAGAIGAGFDQERIASPLQFPQSLRDVGRLSNQVQHRREKTSAGVSQPRHFLGRLLIMETA